MWINRIVGKVDLLGLKARILHAARYVSGVTNLLHARLAGLDLSGHLVGDTCAAEYGGANDGGNHTACKRGRHEPEAPAKIERVLGHTVDGHILILRVQHKIPADRVEHKRQQCGDQRADHKIKRKAVLESWHAERQLRDDDEQKAEAVEGGAGGDERRRIALKALRSLRGSIEARVPQGRVSVTCPSARGYAHIVEHVRS